LAQASNTKSYAHTWPASVGCNGRGRVLATRRRGRFFGSHEIDDTADMADPMLPSREGRD